MSAGLWKYGFAVMVDSRGEGDSTGLLRFPHFEYARAGEVFEKPEPRIIGLRAHEAQEVLLVAKWFRPIFSEYEKFIQGPLLNILDLDSFIM
ncbi:hypothetical protein F0U62_36205 [Cystobacter fuscus]|uniref:hypothetical protein n=1 Tax=Cystobacter fuscus TaxID=43 RepID=UPI002B2FE76A|nr:hypothetical protein F0U62_36205 [Cystobacter fuscus]